MPEIRLTMIADEGSVYRQLAVFLEACFTVPKKELTRSRVIALAHTEAWQRAYAMHCLVRDLGQGTTTYFRKEGKAHPAEPKPSEVIAHAKKVFNDLWNAIKAAGFTMNPDLTPEEEKRADQEDKALGELLDAALKVVRS